MRLGRDGIAGLIGLAVSLVLLPFAYGLPKLPIVPIGPGFYPTVVLVLMAGLCALLVAQDIVGQRRASRTEATDAGFAPAYGLVFWAFAIVAAYIALLPQLGFRLATVLFVGTFQGVIERPSSLRQWIILLAIAVLTSAVTYLVFDQYLSVLLPRGRWTGW